ncbi:proline-rich receptor-like protein kinase PERK2 [Penaeus chinensis]|uniref:proline-rich receptor-like protein kinase PERK2 n=1 Tax=Penaeus chinensis TaxID=139456 RepID=UPI001FB61698|nr:proline-rich receptor-like protein kinase PERK2 [Penaeus chinensis]
MAAPSNGGVVVVVVLLCCVVVLRPSLPAALKAANRNTSKRVPWLAALPLVYKETRYQSPNFNFTRTLSLQPSPSPAPLVSNLLPHPHPKSPTFSLTRTLSPQPSPSPAPLSPTSSLTRTLSPQPSPSPAPLVPNLLPHPHPKSLTFTLTRTLSLQPLPSTAPLSPTLTLKDSTPRRPGILPFSAMSPKSRPGFPSPAVLSLLPEGRPLAASGRTGFEGSVVQFEEKNG